MGRPETVWDEYTLYLEQAERNGISPMKTYREFVEWFLKGYRRQVGWFEKRIKMFEEELAKDRAELERLQRMLEQYEAEAKKLKLEATDE